jgi:hypothetical protein
MSVFSLHIYEEMKVLVYVILRATWESKFFTIFNEKNYLLVSRLLVFFKLFFKKFKIDSYMKWFSYFVKINEKCF